MDPHHLFSAFHVLSNAWTMWCSKNKNHLKKIMIVIKDEYLLQFHCSFQNFNGIVTLIPAENSICILNKVEIKEATKLSQGKQFKSAFFFNLKNF